MKVNKKVHEIELIKNNESYLVLYKENYFSVGQLFYELLQELKSDTHKREKFIEVHNISNENYEELSVIVSTKIEDIVSGIEINKNYIKLTIPIFSEKKVIKISQHLAFFFKSSVFKFLFPLVIIAAFCSQFIVLTKYQAHSIFDLSIFDTFFVYSIILLIMLFHEFGHSSASKYFKIEPKEIGFGFYIIFPVLYSNVTRIWKLNKNDKVIVNLGGIYFQGLVNCFFLFFLIFNDHYNQFTYQLLLIIKANLFLMIYSLFPFVRNDGYWVVSDYFNIIDLNKKSYSYIFDLIKKEVKLKYSLLVYSIGQYLFVLYLCYRYIPVIPSNICAFMIFLKKNGFFILISEKPGLLIKLIFSLLIGLVSLSTFFRFIKPFFKSEKELL